MEVRWSKEPKITKGIEMPMGPGTYGSKVGRPKKKNNAKKVAVKKAPKKAAKKKKR